MFFWSSQSRLERCSVINYHLSFVQTGWCYLDLRFNKTIIRLYFFLNRINNRQEISGILNTIANKLIIFSIIDVINFHPAELNLLFS